MTLTPDELAAVLMPDQDAEQVIADMLALDDAAFDAALDELYPVRDGAGDEEC